MWASGLHVKAQPVCVIEVKWGEERTYSVHSSLGHLLHEPGVELQPDRNPALDEELYQVGVGRVEKLCHFSLDLSFSAPGSRLAPSSRRGPCTGSRRPPDGSEARLNAPPRSFGSPTYLLSIAGPTPSTGAQSILLPRTCQQVLGKERRDRPAATPPAAAHSFQALPHL